MRLLVRLQVFLKFPACQTGRTAALTRQEADSVSGDLGDCADENNETFAKRHSEREREREREQRQGVGGGVQALRKGLLTRQEDNTSDHSKR